VLWLGDFKVADGPEGDLGAGNPELGSGRGRKGEFQLYEQFGSAKKGPVLQLRVRMTAYPLPTKTTNTAAYAAVAPKTSCLEAFVAKLIQNPKIITNTVNNASLTEKCVFSETQRIHTPAPRKKIAITNPIIVTNLWTVDSET
jgi:hypothetical protein